MYNYLHVSLCFWGYYTRSVLGSFHQQREFLADCSLGVVFYENLFCVHCRVPWHLGPLAACSWSFMMLLILAVTRTSERPLLDSCGVYGLLVIRCMLGLLVSICVCHLLISCYVTPHHSGVTVYCQYVSASACCVVGCGLIHFCFSAFAASAFFPLTVILRQSCVILRCWVELFELLCLSTESCCTSLQCRLSSK